MAKARTEFASALNQIASEKGVEPEVVLDAIRTAALAAYRKDLGLRNEEVPEDFEEYISTVDPISGEITILHDGKNVTPPGFARIAASIARQVILQKLHEAEKGAIMDEYETKIGTVISGAMQRQEGNTWYVDLGRAEGVLPASEQIHGEYYHSGQRLKFYIKEIRDGSRGPEVILSRSDSALVKVLFGLEVPEIQSGNVKVEAIAREAGGRTKIAVASIQEGVDPVGSLVGQKGVRVQAVMQELGEEKIDIISYSEDPARFIAAALSPAKEVVVRLNEETKIATVQVPSTQLSLAIGKGGQNVRLAAKLTGWKIDIEGVEEKKEEVSEAPSKEVKDLPAEETSTEAEMSEATDLEKTEVEAVKDAVEENITEAQKEENALQEEPADNAQAAAVAEADIEEDQGNEKEKLAEDLGSMEETSDTERGDIIATEQPSEEDAPTVANTSEATVTDAEPAVEGAPDDSSK